jgi:hypothetical protein
MSSRDSKRSPSGLAGSEQARAKFSRIDLVSTIIVRDCQILEALDVDKHNIAVTFRNHA